MRKIKTTVTAQAYHPLLLWFAVVLQWVLSFSQTSKTKREILGFKAEKNYLCFSLKSP